MTPDQNRKISLLNEPIPQVRQVFSEICLWVVLELGSDFSDITDAPPNLTLPF